MPPKPSKGELDAKDRQLIEILARNCRVAHTIIGDALKVAKDTVSYRLKQLEKSEFLNQYVLFVDARKLGFTRYHLLIQLEAPPSDLRELCRDLTKNPFVMWINTFIGRYDLQVIVDAKDGFHLNEIRSDLFARCKYRVKEYSVLTHLSDLEFTNLNPVLDSNLKFERKADQSFSDLLAPRRFPVEEVFQKVEISRREAGILKALADDPRASISDIANSAGCDRQTARRSIVGLIKSGVILSFSAIPDLSRMGFVTYYLLVRIRQDTPAKTLERPFEQLRNIFYAGKMIGEYDVILYLNARNPTELHESIGLFRDELGEAIVHYELLVQDRVHYWRQYTAGIHTEMTRK